MLCPCARAGWLPGWRRTLTTARPAARPVSPFWKQRIGKGGPRSGQRIGQSNLKRPMQRPAADARPPGMRCARAPPRASSAPCPGVHVRVRVRVPGGRRAPGHTTQPPVIRPPRDGARHPDPPSIHRPLGSAAVPRASELMRASRIGPNPSKLPRSRARARQPGSLP